MKKKTKQKPTVINSFDLNKPTKIKSKNNTS